MSTALRALVAISILTVVTFSPRFVQAQERIESNIVYGMYSGLALVLDVYYPAAPNGYGVIYIFGSGWHAPLDLDAVALKDQDFSLAAYGGAQFLVDAGYTVFAINHRAAPRFRYPAAVEDAQRAVRYIRHNSGRFGIAPEKIGALGNSSGGHLVSMLGVLDGKGDIESSSPIEQESAKVQAVVALNPAADLLLFLEGGGSSEAVGSFLGTIPFIQPEIFREASPTTHATPDDAPFLLIHGDADDVVPFNQSESLQARLERVGVPVEFRRVSGGGHGRLLYPGPQSPNHVTAMIAWFDRNLRDVH